MTRQIERLLACLCLLAAQAVMFYVAVVRGLGITPRSWGVIAIAIACSAALAAMSNKIRDAADD
jgi:hypothetical protein